MPIDLKTKNNRYPKEIERYEEFEVEYSEETNYEEVIHQWKAFEHEPYSVGRKFYIFSTIFLGALITYAIFSNSPIMAITFILIGIVGYLFLQKEPRVIDFKITCDGIIAENEIYEFDTLKSFWIFYNPPYEKILSLRSKSAFVPYIHIPIGDEDPVLIRSIIIDFIPEIKQEHGIADSAERLLHM